MVSPTLKQQLLDLLPKELKGQALNPFEIGFGEAELSEDAGLPEGAGLPEDLMPALPPENDPVVVLWKVRSPGPDGYSTEARSELMSRFNTWR